MAKFLQQQFLQQQFLQHRWLRRWFGTLVRRSPALVILGTGAIAFPAQAAERILVNYGLLEVSTAVSSLDTFAQTGEIPTDLARFTRYLDDDQRQELQTLLATRAEVSPVAIAQFLYTPQGEILLRRLGEVIRTEAHLSGFSALRAALILAAADPVEGLTPINVLRQFPINGIRIDLERTLDIAAELEQLINQTSRAIAAIEQLSALEAATEPSRNFNQLADLRQPGPYTWIKPDLDVKVAQRDRQFPVDLYLPTYRNGVALDSPAPLVVISHGLGSDRTAYAYLAEHLASYGFGVAVPDHVGSNADQLQALIEGRRQQVAEPIEFLDRPLDIQFLLNYLETESKRNPAIGRRLNLQQVGVIGQSFGGYTALALAGATLNRPQLQTDCVAPEDSFNLSLLLQCQALALPDIPTALTDDRVKAAIAINPIGSSVFGETGFGQIKTPVMLVTGSADTIAPTLLEQIYPFTWLTTPDRYLVLLRGSTHFSTIGAADPNTPSISLPDAIIGPSPETARDYLNVLSVAFLKTYLAGEGDRYRPYLGSGYTRFISAPWLPLRLVNTLSPTQLAEFLATDATAIAMPDQGTMERSPVFSSRDVRETGGSAPLEQRLEWPAPPVPEN